jgi:hypothetical protein
MRPRIAAVAGILPLLAAVAADAQGQAPPLAPSPPGAEAQTAQPAPPTLEKAQIEQLLAPIALYPDDLLAQVLAASTYPLEIVMAARWVADPKNAALEGDALTQALAAESWDPSVKSLVPFPTVLKMMSERLEWTEKLGDAFLAEPQQCLAAAQSLRRRAQSVGKLSSTPQQTVTTQDEAIVIAPANPEVVYVPSYDPGVAYGGWPYPDYPPYYYPPPAGGALAAGLATGLVFGAGVAIAGGLWGWGSPGWSTGSINVNVNRFNAINVNRTAIANNTWRHDAVHRHGVAYRDAATRQRFAPQRAGAASRRDYRGFQNAAAGGGSARPGAGAIANRPAGGGARPGGGAIAHRPAGGAVHSGGAVAGRAAAARSAAAARPRPAAFRPGNGAQARAAQARGQFSRQQMHSFAGARPHGGGFQRSGGGGGFHGGGARGGGGGGFHGGGGARGGRHR